VTQQPSTTETTELPVRRWEGLTIPTPGRYQLDEAHKRVGFQTQHMMVSPVRGEFTQARAAIVIAEDPLRSAVSASILTSSISTQNDDRDAHLRSADFLDVERYPTLEFRSTRVEHKRPAADPMLGWARLRGRNPERSTVLAATSTTAEFAVHGVLTICGVSRPTTLDLTFGGASRDPYGRDIFGFSAVAEIDREDFGLTWNVVLEAGGWLVGKKVRIEIAGEAIRQSED